MGRSYIGRQVLFFIKTCIVSEFEKDAQVFEPVKVIATGSTSSACEEDISKLNKEIVESIVNGVVLEGHLKLK